ncbi:CRIB DOMAIN-CONTAINING PROTEIN RIC4 [Salix purpurea]|uniref:CRIB DOMAIN-CONTAINING PROTEIN RIC4 n=1 Tax=Salix purpurea TaxID=77065 RepID=A0A9Q0SRR1_SALPP|nr:CRIB DOMAIN-CONTAINING PROTEIN RIC4 [Salix purpurea]
MRDHKERFVVLPFSLGCASQSSVAVAATDKPCRKPKHETKSSHAARRQEGREESSGQEKTRSNTFSSLALPNPNMSSGMHKLPGGLIGQRVYREEEEDDEQMEREMEIGFPTDVKHLTHIGLDGTATTSNPIKGWESLKPPEIISFPSLSLSHFELAMAAQAHGSVFEVDHSNPLLIDRNSLTPISSSCFCST